MDGVINVYKETGITSFDAVRAVRKIAHSKKVGHTGTLDPEASGVLPICIGRATKIVDYIMNSRKTYVAELKLGITTDSYDREGKILEQNDVNITEEQVVSAITTFVGESFQVPPMYSALKVGGKKLYELARQGIEIEREARKITIYDLDIISINLPYVLFRVRCSKGTYIRSLCYDIGNLLGCGGTMWNLERTETGAFNKENSIHLSDLTEDNINQYIIPIEQCLAKFEKVSFDRNFEKLLLNGVTLNNPSVVDKVNPETLYRVYIEEDFIGIGEKQKSGFKIIKLLI